LKRRALRGGIERTQSQDIGARQPFRG
jgi:hypothetical protein